MAQLNTAVNPTWDLSQPERIDVSHKNINWSEAATFAEHRLNTLQKAQSTLKKEEEEFIKKEKEFLQGSLNFLNTFTKANLEFVAQEQANIKRINDEVNAQRPELDRINASTEETRTAIRDIENRILQANELQKTLSNRRRDIVDQIHPDKLAEIKIKDFMDTNNDLFKWVIAAVYKESTDKYEWKNFSKQALKKDKGKDFLDRLRGLNLTKLRKDDFISAKSVLDRRAEIQAGLEPKGKENPSLRALFDYIQTVFEVGTSHDQVEADKLLLEEQQKELEKKSAEHTRINNVVSTLEDKIAASTYYIDTLNRLKPLFTSCVESTQERLNLQQSYQSGLGGNPHAVENMTQSIQKATTYEPVIEQKASQPLETAKEAKFVQEEEEGFSGEQVQNTAKPKLVESKNVPATDLKESEFANSKKGSCESCGIF